ncbi:MAG: helix-turn-helix domain-containing protein [Pseudomonadales bacterium]
MSAKLSIRAFSFASYTHLHDYHQLVIPIRGAADNFTPLGDGRIGPGQGIVFPAGCEHRFVPDEQSSFLVADFSELPASMLHLSHPVVTLPAAVQAFCHYVERQLEYPVSETLATAMGDMLLALLNEQDFLPRLDVRIARVIEHMEKQISHTPSLCELAAIACLSTSQLKLLFKREMGLSTLQYLTQLRMAKARALLAHTDTPISLIAQQMGYSDVSAFSQRFRSHYGHTPRNSKKQPNNRAARKRK